MLQNVRSALRMSNMNMSNRTLRLTKTEIVPVKFFWKQYIHIQKTDIWIYFLTDGLLQTVIWMCFMPIRFSSRDRCEQFIILHIFSCPNCVILFGSLSRLAEGFLPAGIISTNYQTHQSRNTPKKCGGSRAYIKTECNVLLFLFLPIWDCKLFYLQCDHCMVWGKSNLHSEN